MKQLLTTARNLRLSLIEDKDDIKFAPEIEVVLALMEREHEFYGADIKQVEKLETVRFAIKPDNARKLAEIIIEWADDADRLAAMAVVDQQALSGTK